MNHLEELKKAALNANLHGWTGFEDALNADGYSEAVSKFIQHCSPSVILELIVSHEAAQKGMNDFQRSRDRHHKVSVGLNERLIASEAALSVANEMVPVTIDSGVIHDANRYRFLRDEDAWGEDSDSWDVETRTGLISSENLMELRLDHFDAAIDARMAASDIPFLNPANVSQKPVVLPRVAAIHAELTDVARHRTSVENIQDVVEAIKAAGGKAEGGDNG